VAVVAGDQPAALSMANPATRDPLAADQPMTLFRRVIALAREATSMPRSPTPPACGNHGCGQEHRQATWLAPAAYAGAFVCGLRGDGDAVPQWRGRAAERAAGQLSGNLTVFAAFADASAALEESLAGWQRIGSRFEQACTLLLIPDLAAQGHAELETLGCPTQHAKGRDRPARVPMSPPGPEPGKPQVKPADAKTPTRMNNSDPGKPQITQSRAICCAGIR
jgi:hypothetical protein